MEHNVGEDRVSMIVDSHEIPDAESDSECESSGQTSRQFADFARTGMIRLEEGESDYGSIKKIFFTGMGPNHQGTDVVAIHKNSFSSLTEKARLKSFMIFSEAVSQKCGGNPNIKPAWYPGSRDEICQIITHGFSQCEQSHGNEIYRSGLHLYSNSIYGSLASVEDENGWKHMLLCRAILGKTEVVPSGARQFQPSSEEFDSGIDNRTEPRRYIIWNAYMNTCALPNYIVSFRVDPSILPRGMRDGSLLRFSFLIALLARMLDPLRMTSIFKCYRDYRNNRITRRQFITKLRQVAGDRMLLTAIRLCRRRFLPSAAA